MEFKMNDYNYFEVKYDLPKRESFYKKFNYTKMDERKSGTSGRRSRDHNPTEIQHKKKMYVHERIREARNNSLDRKLMN